MAPKFGDLWHFHGLVASYVLRTKKLCDILLKDSVDEPAILKLLAEIKPSSKLHNPKRYYPFGAAFVAANQKADFQLNPLYANWHHRFVRDADEFHRLLRELGRDSESLEFEKAASIAAEFKPKFEKCTLQFLKTEVNAATLLLNGSSNDPSVKWSKKEPKAAGVSKSSSDNSPSDYVTLQEMASHSGKTQRSLRKYLSDGLLPPPSIQKSGADPDQWEWLVVKPVLERFREQSQSLTVPELAKKWGVSTKKIYALIKGGELKAINTSVGPGKRPRYSIARSAIEEYEQKRGAGANAVSLPRRPRARRSSGVSKWF